MTKMQPDIKTVKKIIAHDLHEQVVYAKRFETGLCHFVYDVRTETRECVVRIAWPQNVHYLKGACHWELKLSPIGVPIARILFCDIEGETVGFPYIILQRLPGADLGEIYFYLSRSQKMDIARKMASVQKIVMDCGPGVGYGEIMTDRQNRLYANWTDFLAAALRKAALNIRANGVFGSGHVAPAWKILDHKRDVLNAVRPLPFLDDITTKNVIVTDEGDLSGIVDVDLITYGDPLFNVALTKMSLLNMQAPTDYVDYFLEALTEMDAEKQFRLDFYTLVHGLGFMGELGQPFNKSVAEPVTEAKKSLLGTIVQNCYEML